MNKEEIIKEYKNYCSDLNIDFKKTSNKNRFMFDYLKYLYNIGNLKLYGNTFEESKINIMNMLKGVK